MKVYFMFISIEEDKTDGSYGLVREWDVQSIVILSYAGVF